MNCLEMKIYTPTTELEILQAKQLSYIFKEAVKYRELWEKNCKTELVQTKAHIKELEELLSHIAKGKCYCSSPSFIECYPCKARELLEKSK